MSGSLVQAETRARAGRVAIMLTATTVVALDLGAKAVSEVRLADTSVDLGALQLQLTYNTGVAFSMGNKLPAMVIVAGSAVIASAIIAYAWRRAPRAGWAELIAWGAVIGGAVANVIDRALDGAVTDYLHTGWWPSFNLADAFLVIGLVVIALRNARGTNST